MDAHSYNITVRRDVVDSETVFVATVKEFPHVVVYADSAAEAYDEAIGVVDDLLQAAKEEGRAAPTPRAANNEYNGRVTLRMPPALHRKLVMAADESDVSLNLLIVTTLAESLGGAAPRSEIPGMGPSVISYSVDPEAMPTAQDPPKVKLYAVN